ncbi:uncharacterized protein LOC114975799 isoform X2 [Acropora millepora]|uniref:uncharacterized protein LOC114975799 isoform X2 n=1 Tax=Acropora millepora TaxID=45264 RepID=UPI0010FCB10A|nr:uncharacterized protein LOC114975799 isoform X2 [Acropora millepora]
MAETETELSESEAEIKPQTSLSASSKSSSREFTGAARYKSTFQAEWTTNHSTFLRQDHEVVQHKDRITNWKDHGILRECMEEETNDMTRKRERTSARSVVEGLIVWE